MFRNSSVSNDIEAAELACDGVILDMAYSPVRFVFSLHMPILAKMLWIAVYCFKKSNLEPFSK